jgi:hypothetical protein
MMRVRSLDLKFLNELATMMRARGGEMRVPGTFAACGHGVTLDRRQLRGNRRPVLIAFRSR